MSTITSCRRSSRVKYPLLPRRGDADDVTGVEIGIGHAAVPWTIEDDKAFGASIGVRTAVLSVTAPGVTHISDPQESARVARVMNEYCSQLRDEDPCYCGWFATIPSLEHMELALEELRYALDVLKADGVTLFTNYGGNDGYLGNDKYVPIWEELNRRKTVVFVHPIGNKDRPHHINASLPMPAFDWPHETGRTAMDLITNRRLQQFPDVKIILSHAGGSLPLLARRSTMIELPQFGAVISAADIMAQAKSFYFDLALSGSPEILPLILNFAKPDHVLFGSDYPHATPGLSAQYTQFTDDYDMSEEQRKDIYYRNAVRLFPRLKEFYEP